MLKGISFVECDHTPIDVPICQEEGEPQFIVKVRNLPVRRYQAIFAKLSRFQGAGFRKQQQESSKVDREYLEEVIEGWEGCTPKNWTFVCRDGKALRIEDEVTGKDVTAERTAQHWPIPFDIDMMIHLYQNSWPDSFGNLIFQAVKGEIDKAEAEEQKAKKP